MQNRLLQLMVLVIAGSLMVGCSRNTKDSSAADENQGLSPEELAAQTQGTADSAGLEGSAMNDGSGSDLSAIGAGSGRIIYFEYDSSEIREEFRPIIEAAVSYLAGNPSGSVTLEGHTDERGSREYNLALGERRAQAVERQMTLLGAASAS